MTNYSLFPIPPKVDDVFVYHDEIKEANGRNIWGHALLFIPEKKKINLYNDLQEIRNKTKCNSKLHFSDISPSVYTPKYECAKQWIELGEHYLKRRNGCKLGIIFFDKSSANLSLYKGEKKEKQLRFVETVLRIILKGSVHFLYNKDWQVKLLGIITDGNPWHRKLDKERILDELLDEVRDYVVISPNAEIFAVFSDHKDERCDDPVSANLLQLTDLLLGSVTQCFFRLQKAGDKKEIIVRPIREMLDKIKRGKNFKNSSHFKSFSISKATIINGKWNFEPLHTRSIEKQEELTLNLFDFDLGDLYETN